jgi:cysteine-rich repeat protein
MRLILLSFLFVFSCTPEKSDDSAAAPAETSDDESASDADDPPADDSSAPTDDSAEPDDDLTDADEDGFLSDIDCDDLNPNVHPDANEICDDIDNDCDGLTDDADDSLDLDSRIVWYADGDGDGYGNEAYPLAACTAPENHVPDGHGQFDCDDADARYNPGASETDCADPNDYNCDGSVGYADADGDGWAACQECHDLDADIHPGAIEVCDYVDNDCDGMTDDEDDGLDVDTRYTFYTDADGDGFGDESLPVRACSEPEGAVDGEDGFDCDDEVAAIHPDALEICDDEDNDCDGDIDDADSDVTGGTTWFIDYDGDGHGSASYYTTTCDVPTGYVSSTDDCDDTNSTVFPGATEVCDGLDNDCDGVTDGADALGMATWYADSDGDGYGDADITTDSCSASLGYVADNTDCNDESSDVHPGAPELCDELDNDCDGITDGADAIGMATWHVDADADGYGDPDSTVMSCSAGLGFVSDSSDCDDSTATTHPGADELCDGIDNNCNDIRDDGLPDLATFYRDSDGDGEGDEESAITACDTPPGYAANSSDCDDTDATIFTGAGEDCFDGYDNNCDAETDCEDVDDCRVFESSCWSCGDGYLDTLGGEECDDGNTLSGDGCDSSCIAEMDLSGLEVSWSSEGRTVYVWKSSPSVSLSSYNSFCEERGLAWFTPDSSADAQKVITDLYERDMHHTWIITKNNTTSSPTWGGYSVTVDSPSCVDTSSSGFSAIRKWSCSMCEPESYDRTYCWDTGHSYDWLVCEDV